MTTSKEHLEYMHARLQQVAKREQLLIESLNEALCAADRRLLDDVRSVTLEHEARRAVILEELQTLASRIGAFAADGPPLPMLEDDALELPYYAPDEALPVDSDKPKAEADNRVDYVPSNGGDWRKAAEKIRDDFDLRFDRREAVS